MLAGVGGIVHQIEGFGEFQLSECALQVCFVLDLSAEVLRGIRLSENLGEGR